MWWLLLAVIGIIVLAKMSGARDSTGILRRRSLADAPARPPAVRPCTAAAAFSALSILQMVRARGPAPSRVARAYV